MTVLTEHPNTTIYTDFPTDLLSKLSAPVQDEGNNHKIFRTLEKAPKVVVFDFDGTLAESEIEHQVKLGVAILYAYGYEDITMEHFDYYVRKGDPLGVLPVEDREKLESRFWNTFNSHSRPQEALLPETIETLMRLKKAGCELAIFTARPMSYSNDKFMDALCSLGILHFFSVVEGNRHFESIRGSDKTAQIDAISEALQVSPGEMLIVGDTRHDIEAGKYRHAGYTVAVRSGGFCCNWLEEASPDAIVDSVLDVARMVEAVA